MANSLAAGAMAGRWGAGLQCRVSERGGILSGVTALPGIPRVALKGNGRKVVSVISAKGKGLDGEPRLVAVAGGVVTNSAVALLANAGAAQALTKEDVSEAYTKVELFSTQVQSTAGSAFQTAKHLFDQVFTTVKPGLDAAVPYVRQTTETVTKIAGPLASDIAGEAQKALRNAGVNPEPGLEFAKNAAEQTSKVLGGARPLGSSALESALAAGPLFLAEAAGGLVLFYFLAPVLVSAIANSARGYAGDLAAPLALDLLLKEDYSLIDVRTDKEKSRSGVPSLPSSSKSKYVAIPVEELPGKVKSQVRNYRKVEAEVAGIKIAALKRLNKGSKIVVMDESGDIGKIVARVLEGLGFKNSYVIVDGFKGGRGWVQSRLGIEDYSSASPSFAEILSPSRIIPAGTKKYGASSGTSSSRFNLLPGGVDE